MMSNPNNTQRPSTSHDLIHLGPRHVQAKYRGKRDENGLKPSTSRALVLRNGKYGVRGTGEIMLVGRITGREKLDLLAEDLVSQKSRNAVMAPLDLGKCIRIADSQYNAYLDDIANLKDPDMFYYKIMSELIARLPRGTQSNQQSLRNPLHVVSVISTRIHNAYMIASGWRLVISILRDLQNVGLKDATARAQLQADDSLRSRYLVVSDIIGVLVDLGQAHFAVLAMTSPHYSQYFKEVENVDPGEPSIAFDWASLKDACKSFLDSIVIELCFPSASYPRRILCQILHDAVDECPGEAKRFPQSMWDAVGDLSISLELQELLESPLLGPQGEMLRTLPKRMPEQYERWLDAQAYSKQVSESYANFKDLISPLERTKHPSVLDSMWERIDLNHKIVSGRSVDSLWQLDGAFRRTPHWNSIYMPSLRAYDSESDGERSPMPLLRSGEHKKTSWKKKRKKYLAITDGQDDYDSMPELQSFSDDSDDKGEDVSVSENDEQVQDDGDDGDESNYDPEEEEVYRTMLREAMDTAMAIPEFFDPKSTVPNFDELAGERRGNPFLKLLGSLRGRMFSSDPKLSSTARTEPRNGFFGKKYQTTNDLATRTVASAPDTKVFDASSSKTSSVQHTTSKERTSASTSDKLKDHCATVEDAGDEEDVPSIVGKKKKKRPKKKKKEGTNELSTVQQISSFTSPENLLSDTVLETPFKAHSGKYPTSNASLNSHAHMSTSSLQTEPTHAQSGYSYLRELNFRQGKVKSRPDHASLVSDKKTFLPNLGSKDKTKKEDESDPTINKKFTWFTKLGKKTTGYMHQLLRINADEKVGTLKWDDFVKVMRDMGFKYDPSTAGSSVRFDPPSLNDTSITFHKPHPNSTLQAHHLRDFGKRLKRQYGWSEEDFMRRTNIV